MARQEDIPACIIKIRVAVKNYQIWKCVWRRGLRAKIKTCCKCKCKCKQKFQNSHPGALKKQGWVGRGRVKRVGSIFVVVEKNDLKKYKKIELKIVAKYWSWGDKVRKYWLWDICVLMLVGGIIPFQLIKLQCIDHVWMY